METIRGQLGVKSGPLAPTSAKLTSQMLVVDHMVNHYKKIKQARGKGAIDNTPPASLFKSQKMRDRHAVKYIEKYGTRPPSRTNSRMSTSMLQRPESGLEDDIYDERQWGEPEDDDSRAVHQLMRETLRTSSYRVPLKAHHDIMNTAGLRSEPETLGTKTIKGQSASLRGVAQTVVGANRLNSRPVTARSTTSLASNFSQTSRTTNPLKVTYGGDVLDKHAHFFKETERAFTPRTLKSNRESSLKNYKYYTPPRQKTPSVAWEEVNGNNIKSENEASSSGHPKPKPRRSESLGSTGKLTESMLMDYSLQSHGTRSGGRNDVPRLDITMDKDHRQWVEEQATRAKERVHNDSVTAVPEEQNGTETIQQAGTAEIKDTLRFTHTGRSQKSRGFESPTSRRLGQAKEEERYVAFAEQVTADIASRSITSDRVMQNIFQKHIDKNKDILDERRLQAIISDIRNDLGVNDIRPVGVSKGDISYYKDTSTFSKEDNERLLENVSELSVNQDRKKYVESMETTNVLNETENTYNFDRTTDVLSTIHSQTERDENEFNGTLSATQDFSVSQTLRQYQRTLTDQVRAEEEAGEASDSGRAESSPALGGSSIGSITPRGDSSPPLAAGHSLERMQPPRPAARARRQLQRQDASLSGQEPKSVSKQLSAAEAAREPEPQTDGNQSSVADATVEDEELGDEEVEEEYESDYDADEDGSQKMSDSDF